jgi:hypothetical protein
MTIAIGKSNQNVVYLMWRMTGYAVTVSFCWLVRFTAITLCISLP